MWDTIFFLGRFHVLALHLPIGMLVAAIAVDWLGRSPRHRGLAAAAPFLWGTAAVSAVATVVLGYMHFAEGAFTGASAALHRIYGTLLAVACVAVWTLSAKRPSLHRKLGIVTGLALLGLVTLTGHYGGKLTHGSAYLIEYAPQPLRALAGLPPRRAAVTDLASADPWHDLVGPLLDTRCGSCHNDDKRSGGFSVAAYESTLAGGDTGSVIVPGNVEFSELYHRVTLPDDDEAFMPAEGKTPLTAEQVEILRWWIAAGAPVDTPVAAVETPAEIQAILAIEVGLAGGDVEAPATAVAPDPAVLESLFEAGFLTRAVSQSDPRLIVSVHSVGADLDAEQLGVLGSAAAHVVELDLRAAGLEDADLEGFEAFTELKHLRLAENALTDAGVQALSGLPKLAVLNLYGNAGIGDGAVDALAAMPMLETVYLWQTGVTEDGAVRLESARLDVEIDLGGRRRVAPEGVQPATEDD